MPEHSNAAKNINLLIKIQTVAKILFNMDKKNNEYISNRNQIENNYKNAEKEYVNIQEEMKSINKNININKNKIDEYINKIQNLKEKEKYIKTQKQYIALDTEIALARENIVELEKKINEEENINKLSLTQELSEKKLIFDQKKNIYEQTKKEINQKLKEIKNKINNAKKTKEKITPDVDPYILRRYENIVKKKDGIGIVPIIEGICEGCYIRITPQLMSKLMQNKEIIYCPNCARILYLPQKSNSI